MAYKIKPNTEAGKDHERAHVARAAKVDALLEEVGTDITALSGVADANTRAILRNLLQRQRVILRAIAKG